MIPLTRWFGFGCGDGCFGLVGFFAGLGRQLSSWKARLAPIFGRRELRETGWMMAEQAGLARPWRMQGLLGRSRWDAEVLVEEVRSYVVEALGSADGVLVVDETGFLKKDRHSVGVARQYSGMAGRIENCQVGVFLGYAGPLGQALIDRQLYLPRDWAGDAERRAAVGVPEDIPFATKPMISAELIARALDSGLPCAWVLADAVYGSDSHLRRMLEAREQPYVLAVRSNHVLRFVEPRGLVQSDPATLADELDPAAWRCHAAGEGSKGPRLYDWARIALPWVRSSGWQRWVLVRRSRKDPGKRAYYFVFCPLGTSLAELAGAAGLRWTIEECFQRAKDELGLDHCEARSWHGWHRHMSLVMAAAAFLAKLAADLRRDAGVKANETSPRAQTAA